MALREGQVFPPLSVTILVVFLATFLVPSCNSGAVQLDNNNIDGSTCHLFFVLRSLLIFQIILTFY